MLTLVVATAAVLGVTLVLGVIAVVGFLIPIRRFLRDTAMALEAIDEPATRLAGRVARIQESTRAAASRVSGKAGT